MLFGSLARLERLVISKWIVRPPFYRRMSPVDNPPFRPPGRRDAAASTAAFDFDRMFFLGMVASLMELPWVLFGVWQPALDRFAQTFLIEKKRWVALSCGNSTSQP
jgi:hypothetical protein